MREKLFHRDFTLVVIGQIISLLGNAVLRFVLPLYLLDVTGSRSLFGLCSAAAFVPMVVLTPLGGVVADRLHKQRIMVVLDFFTCALVALTALALGHLPLVPVLVAAMMLLYGISGAYQPAVRPACPCCARRTGWWTVTPSSTRSAPCPACWDRCWGAWFTVPSA